MVSPTDTWVQGPLAASFFYLQPAASSSSLLLHVQLGVIRLQRIYNFLLFHAIILYVLDV